MMPSSFIEFRNYGKLGGADEVFGTLFNGRFDRRGDDLLVPGAAFGAAVQRPLVHCGPKTEIEFGNHGFSKRLISSTVRQEAWRLQETFSGAQKHPEDKRYGILSDLECASNEVALAQSSSELEDALTRALQALRKHHPITHVTPVSIDFDLAQRWMTLIKIGFLLNEFELEEAKKRLWDRDSFGSIELGAIEILDWLDALTRSSRVQFTIPLHFTGCTWHLYSDAGFIEFGAARAFDGWNALVSNQLPPMSDNIEHQGLVGLDEINGDRIWEYLRYCSNKINLTLSFLNDSRRFRTSEGNIDFCKQLQGYSTFRLLFTDLAALNFSSSAYNGHLYAFSILDKLANLRISLGHNSRELRDAEVAKRMLSISQGQSTSRNLKKHFREMNYEELAEIWSTACDVNFREVREHLRKQFITDVTDESTLLGRLRDQRNIRHGAFLEKDRYKKMFLESAGTVAPNIAAIPYILLLDLISDPSTFLEFSPDLAGSL